MKRMISVEDLITRPTDFVDEKWDQLIEFFRQRDRVVINGPAKVTKGVSYGCKVHYDASAGFKGAFRVTVSDYKIRVSPGLVTDDLPVVGQVDLEGLDIIHEAQGEIPSLEIPKGQRFDSGRSFVCLRAGVDDFGRPAAAPEVHWATVEHIRDIKEARKLRAPYEGFQALGIIYWRNQQITRVKQVVLHNLRHSIQPGGRHFFSGF